MASKVYDEDLIKQILLEMKISMVDFNPTVNTLALESEIEHIKKQIKALAPKEYNRYGKIPSMKDGLFLKLNVTDKINFIDKDINVYLNGVITILQDGDVTRHYDIYAEIIIPKTFINEQCRKTPVVVCCTEDTYLLFKSFITRIVTYNGEYYIQFKFPYMTDSIDEAQDLNVRVYVENEQVTLDLPQDPSAVSIESECKEIPFGSTPNHDPILHADKLVRSDIVRYLTISDTQHIVEDLKDSDPEHLIFRKEDYLIDPTLPPDQQPTPDMVSLVIKYNDSIIWTKDYSVNTIINDGDIVLSPLEGFTLEGIYNKPLSDGTKQKITYPITLTETKVLYANYTQSVVKTIRNMEMYRNLPMVDKEYLECNTKDEFIQKLDFLSKEYNTDLKVFCFILNFISDLSGVFKDMYFQSFPKIIINSDYIDCTEMCNNTTIVESDNFKEFLMQLNNLDHIIFKDSFKNIHLIDDPEYAGILKNPIRIVFKNKYNETIKTFMYNKTQILNLCKYIPYEKYDSVFLNKELTQEIAKSIPLSDRYPSELVFYLKEYENAPYIIKNEDDLHKLQQILLEDDIFINNMVLVFTPEFNTPIKLKTFRLPKSVYFMSNKLTSEPTHLINWELLKGGEYKLDKYFNMIYDIKSLNHFIECSDLTQPAIIDFASIPLTNINTLDSTFGINIIAKNISSVFMNLKEVIHLFRNEENVMNLLFEKKLTNVKGIYYNLYNSQKEYVTYPQIEYNDEKYTNLIISVIDADADEKISKFKLEDPVNVSLKGDLIKLYNLIHPDTLNDQNFIWNTNKYRFKFKAFNFNFNINGFLETEFEKELTVHELIKLVYTKEIKLDEISNNDVQYLDANFDENINSILENFTIICKK